MVGVKNGASERKFSVQSVTRQDVTAMSFAELHAGLVIRSYNYDKWVLKGVLEPVDPDLPVYTRHEFAKTPESELPKRFGLRNNRVVIYVVEEL